MSIGKRIKQRREELGWSQRELCARIGYADHSTISKIELGAVDVPESKIIKFSEVLGVSVAYLLDLENGQKNNDITEDIVYKMKNDEKFFMCVEMLRKLDNTQLQAVTQLLKAFL